MGKKNICRPIIFYNNFVPPVREAQDWNYCAFGTLDGIDVRENIAKEDGQILSNIWKHQIQFCKGLNGKYMAQVIYAIKYDEEESDNAFWSSETDAKYLFTFFVRAQCRGDVMALWEKRAFLQERLEESSGIAASVYVTYDNSDLMIVLKTASYNQGAAIVNTLRQGNNLLEETDRYCILKNSFAVLAVRQSVINASQNLKLDDKIRQVDIRIIEKQGRGIAKIEEKLKSVIKGADGVECVRKQVLGTDDEVLTFFGIPWKAFLSFYNSEEGVLNNAGTEYKEYILGTTAVIMEQVDIIDGIAKKSANQENLAKKQRELEAAESRQYGEYIDRMTDRLDQVRKLENDGCYKSLDIIVNALAKFRQPAFSDYIFVTMVRPLDCLLELIIQNAAKGRGAVQNNRRAYLDFIKSFNMYTQNSIRSDRHSMQVMDLNAKIYDIPVKLNAFYNAYIFRVCNLLNKRTQKTGGVEYDFFAIPGMGDRVSVSELYKRVSKARRLIKVEIPEQKYYDMKGMMIVLTHEVAHYVGSEIRQREYRYENYIQNIAHIYIRYVLYMYNEYRQNHGGGMRDMASGSERFEKRMGVMLKGAMGREIEKNYLKDRKIDTKYLKGYLEDNKNNKNKMEEEAFPGGLSPNRRIDIEKIAEEKEAYQSYISFIKNHSRDALMGIALHNLDDIFASAIYNMEKKEAQDLLELVHQITERFLYEYQEGSTMISMKTVTERLIAVYEECFADLISILLLQLTPGDYFSRLIEDALSQGIPEQDIVSYDYVFRALFVMLCMLKDEGGYVWKIEDIDMLKADSACGTIVRELAILYRKYYINEEKSYEETYYDKNCANIFKDKKTIRLISEYLTECKRKYFEIKQQMYSESDNQMTATIRDLYVLSKNNAERGAEQQMIEQMAFVMTYKRDLFTGLGAGENA